VSHPSWLAYFLGLVMLAVSVCCLGRLLVARHWHRRNDYSVGISHVLMGLAMAGMFVPRWNLARDQVWVVAFGLVAAWFLVLSVRFAFQCGLSGADQDQTLHISHYLIHLVMACAMIYMYRVSVPTSGASSGGMTMGSGIGTQPSYLVVSFVFIVVLFASAFWQLDASRSYSPRQLTLTGGDPSSSLAGVVGDGGAGDGTRSIGSGLPAAGLPAAGLPAAGLPAAGLPAAGLPAAGLPGCSGSSASSQQNGLGPGLERACHIAMCVAMGYMLVVML